jgi:hypothetical protein
MAENPGHAMHSIHLMLKNLPPIREKKNPFLAGVIGFFFGGIGLGIYFKTWQDFVFPILVFVLLSTVIPVLGTIAAFFFGAIWGLVRAFGSGENA